MLGESIRLSYNQDMTAIERPQPYVGISGVGLNAEHAYIRTLWDKTRLSEAGRLLLLGVKGCSNQYENKPNKRGNVWYPCGDAATKALLPPNENELATIQTYFGKQPESYSTKQLLGSTNRMLERMPWTQAIQYDQFPWYEIEAQQYLHELKSARPDLKLLIQLNEKVLSGTTPPELAERLTEQADTWDYALFDTSHGKGVEISTARLSPFIDAVYAHPGLNSMNFAVAGGLDANNLPLITDLLHEYPELSFDSESRLHYQDGRWGGKLIPEAVWSYLQATNRLF
jgi:hypothetical protein